MTDKITAYRDKKTGKLRYIDISDKDEFVVEIEGGVWGARMRDDALPDRSFKAIEIEIPQIQCEWGDGDLIRCPGLSSAKWDIFVYLRGYWHNPGCESRSENFPNNVENVEYLGNIFKS